MGFIFGFGKMCGWGLPFLIKLFHFLFEFQWKMKSKGEEEKRKHGLIQVETLAQCFSDPVRTQIKPSFLYL